jgi:hypothetical protein
MSGIINSVGARGGIVESDVYPAGHIINCWKMQGIVTTNVYYVISTDFNTIDYGIGANGILQVTGISATEGNLLYMTSSPGNLASDDDAAYQINVGFNIDGNAYATSGTYFATTHYLIVPINLSYIFTVPADFDDKTISVNAEKQTDATGSHRMYARGSLLTADDIYLNISVFEIQQ